MIKNCNQGMHFDGVILNINKNIFVDAMLAAVWGRGERQRHIKEIGDLMDTNQWTITAGLHEGGLGGGGFQADPNPHITLRIFGQRNQFHVHYSERPFKITYITP
jgi:hypothetical protein